MTEKTYLVRTCFFEDGLDELWIKTRTPDHGIGDIIRRSMKELDRVPESLDIFEIECPINKAAYHEREFFPTEEFSDVPVKFWNLTLDTTAVNYMIAARAKLRDANAYLTNAALVTNREFLKRTGKKNLDD